MRSGTVTLVGRSNVGKSTFLNAALGEPLAIVSPVPQTTRDSLLGVVHHRDAQIAFVDTPGLHRPKSELGRRMNAITMERLRSADVILFMVDVPSFPRTTAPDQSPIHSDDERLIQLFSADASVVLAINKIDLSRDKRQLLPKMAAFAERFPFRAVVPTSLKNGDGLARVLDELAQLLPATSPRYAADTLTDRPTTFFVKEYVREQILLSTRREVPHAVAVTVDRYAEEPQIVRIAATIHVEKSGQKAIVVGQGGTQIKRIGVAARKRIETLVGCQVHLELFVRVTERWRNAPQDLAELGYDSETARALANLLPDDQPKRVRRKRPPEDRPAPARKPKGRGRAKPKKAPR